jgi:hypothetical protein
MGKAFIQRTAVDADSVQAQRQALQQRRLEVRRIAAELFDFDEIARRALSRHWTSRSAEEQAEFTRLFTDLSQSVEIRVEGAIASGARKRLNLTEVGRGTHAANSARPAGERAR